MNRVRNVRVDPSPPASVRLTFETVYSAVTQYELTLDDAQNLAGALLAVSVAMPSSTVGPLCGECGHPSVRHYAIAMTPPDVPAARHGIEIGCEECDDV
jgi:hypothetical protein